MVLSTVKYILILSKVTNFRCFQTERVSVKILNLIKMPERSPKRVENTVGKGEIARYEQCLLFPHCLQRICTANTLKQ